MAKKPPQRYEPGELDKTRQNLGNLTPNEANEMINKLGGEIGIERTDATIEGKYASIARENISRNRRRYDTFVVNSSSRQDNSFGRTVKNAQTVPSLTYGERVKLNFLCAKEEHQVKRFSNAMASLFSFIFNVHDYVNPHFLRTGDILFFRPIEKLVLSVRTLLAINEKNKVTPLRDPYVLKILNAIKNWDIEGMHEELTRLQKKTDKQDIQLCQGLIRCIYRPIVQLALLDDNQHIGRALKQLYERILFSLPKTHPKIERVRVHYVQAREQIPLVFSSIRFRCYPFLLKHLFLPAQSHSTLFARHWSEILAFLYLKDSDIVPPENLIESHEELVFQEIEHEDEDQEEDEDAADPDTQEEPLSSYLVNGIELLTKLFPGSGWERYELFPDLYPYFHSLLHFSKGFEVVSPEDPMHQIVVLYMIISEFLYGIHSMKFREFMMEDGTYFQTMKRIEETTNLWHSFFDSVVQKNYIEPLYNYCRQIERNPELVTAEYGTKTQADLLWLKRRFILPYLEVNTFQKRLLKLKTRDDISLPELLDKLIGVLTVILKNCHSPLPSTDRGLENADDPISFQIENAVSRRLQTICEREGWGYTNTDLLNYIYILLNSFRTFLTRKNSVYYKNEEIPSFRNDGIRKNLPRFTVGVLDTDFLIKKYDKEKEDTYIPQSIWKDEESGFFKIGFLNNHIHSSIDYMDEQVDSFCFLGLYFNEYLDQNRENEQNGEEQQESRRKNREQIIRESVRSFSDVPFIIDPLHYLMMLHDSRKEDGKVLAYRLIKKLNQKKHSGYSVFIVQNQPKWTPNSVQKLINKTLESPIPSEGYEILIYNPEKRGFDSLGKES